MSGSEPPHPKVPTGIAGLDQMLRGGLPAGHVVLVTGLPGTGKTCFGLQFLMAGVARGET
ncbi:circadian clock protein, KaiC, partial [mine drainage metagenome]